MKRLLVCQHVPYEVLGTLDPLLRRSGFRIRYVNFGRHPDAQPSLDGYQGLVVLGGPMSVNDVDHHPHLATEMRLIEGAIARGMPVLGICLGAQLIARTLGAEIGPSPRKEIGWYDVSLTEGGVEDPLLGHLRETERIFQWHGEAFEIPKSAVHLASSAGCRHQAFRYGTQVYGFQFHLEVDEPLIDRWLRVPANVREIEDLAGEIDAGVIREETKLRVYRLRELADRTFSRFVDLFGAVKKVRHLPSR